MTSKIHAEISLDLAGGKFHHLFGERGLYANPEGVVHHVIRIDQVAADAVVGADHVGLASQVAGKQQAGADLVLVQVGEQVQPGDGAVFFERDGEAEP
jgi:hypothetical protein